MNFQLLNTFLLKLAATNPTIPITNCPNANPANPSNRCDTTLPQVRADPASVHSILQIVFGVIGAASVIIIIIASLQLVTSQGDPQSASRARQSIIYAVIGLVVALSAEVLVTFVLGSI